MPNDTKRVEGGTKHTSGSLMGVRAPKAHRSLNQTYHFFLAQKLADVPWMHNVIAAYKENVDCAEKG